MLFKIITKNKHDVSATIKNRPKITVVGHWMKVMVLVLLMRLVVVMLAVVEVLVHLVAWCRLPGTALDIPGSLSAGEIRHSSTTSVVHIHHTSVLHHCCISWWAGWPTGLFSLLNPFELWPLASRSPTYHQLAMKTNRNYPEFTLSTMQPWVATQTLQINIQHHNKGVSWIAPEYSNIFLIAFLVPCLRVCR